MSGLWTLDSASTSKLYSVKDPFGRRRSSSGRCSAALSLPIAAAEMVDGEFVCIGLGGC